MKIIAVLLVTAIAYGQDSLTFQTGSPPGVRSNSISVSATNRNGADRACYWVIAVYPVGKVNATGPSCIDRLSATSVITIGWTGLASTTSYDVLRYDSGDSLPTSGNLLVTNTVQASISTTLAAVLTAYTVVSPPSSATATLKLDNKNYSAKRLVSDTTIDAPGLLINGAIIAAQGTNHTQNTDTGTTSASFCWSTTGPCFKVIAGVMTLVTDAAGATIAPLATSSISTGATAPTISGGTAGAFANAEGTVPTVMAAAGVDGCYASSTTHSYLCTFNNGAYLPMVRGPASVTDAVVALFDGTSGGLLKASVAVATTATASTIAERNSSGEVIAANTVGTGKTPMATDTAVADAQLAAKHKTRIQSMTVFDPVAGDSGRVQVMFPYAVTITSVGCSVKAATSATVNLDERAWATPDTAGTAVLTSDLACDVDGAISTTFSNAGIAANVPVALTIASVSGTPDTLRVFVTYTID